MEGIGILLLFLSIVLLCILVPIWIIMGLAMNEENSKSIKKTYAITVPPVVIILLVAIILTVIGVKKYSSIPLSFVEDNKLTVLVEGTNSKGTSCDYYLSNEVILSKGKSKSYAGIPIGGVIIHKEGYVFEPASAGSTYLIFCEYQGGGLECLHIYKVNVDDDLSLSYESIYKVNNPDENFKDQLIEHFNISEKDANKILHD